MPAGVFKETYEGDMAFIRYPIHKAALVLAVIAGLSAPLLLDTYYLNLAITALIFWVAVIGLNITVGLAGQISLAQAALMGVGAYTVAFAALKLGVNVVLALPLAGITAMIIGLVLSLPSFKLKEYYLAMASLAAQLLLEYAFSRIDPDQYTPIPPEAKRLASIDLNEPEALYYFTFIVAALMALAAGNIARSSYGRAMKAVRDNDVAASIVGVNVPLTKAIAFGIGGFYAGIAGGLYAIYSVGIGWEAFTLVNSIELLGMVLIGGPGRVVWGSLLGVLVLRTGWTLLESNLVPILAAMGFSAFASAIKYIVLGTLITVVIILEPEGLIAVLRRVKEYFRLWPYSY
ncbi:MAG: branched-chain amino acid ABC transporter permease [Desulfurococcales archaeon]|nr:branched-chain amino acid ABC transporter permease [Desulfurococcales archaeon]